MTAAVAPARLEEIRRTFAVLRAARSGPEADEVYDDLARVAAGLLEATSSMVADGELGDASGVMLTAREVDVLAGVAVGEPNKAIARRLGIGPATVKSYLSSAMVKLGASSRASAVQLARAARVLP